MTALVKPVLTEFSKPYVCTYLGRVRLYDCYDSCSGAPEAPACKGKWGHPVERAGWPEFPSVTSHDVG